MGAVSVLGTRLRALVELLDEGVDAAYSTTCVGYRARFTPVVRALIADGCVTIQTIADRGGVSHSAASQTVAQMRARGLIELKPGDDRREHKITATPLLTNMLPDIQVVWAATAAAAATLDTDLGISLETLAGRAIVELQRDPFGQRISKMMSKNGRGKGE
jgi:hypothetical protein